MVGRGAIIKWFKSQNVWRECVTISRSCVAGSEAVPKAGPWHQGCVTQKSGGLVKERATASHILSQLIVSCVANCVTGPEKLCNRGEKVCNRCEKGPSGDSLQNALKTLWENKNRRFCWTSDFVLSDTTWTCGLYHPKVALSQLSYT